MTFCSPHIIRYPLDKSPYEGIEYLWNHQNFWVCMQVSPDGYPTSVDLS